MVLGDLWVCYPYLAPILNIISKDHDGKVLNLRLKRIIVKCHYYYESKIDRNEFEFGSALFLFATLPVEKCILKALLGNKRIYRYTVHII